MFCFKLLFAFFISGKYFVTAPASGNPLLRGNNGRSTNPLLKGPIDYSQSSNPLMRQNLAPAGGQQASFVQNVVPGTGAGTSGGGSQNSGNNAVATDPPAASTVSSSGDISSQSGSSGDVNGLGTTASGQAPVNGLVTTVAGQPPPPPFDGPPDSSLPTTLAISGSSSNNDDFFKDTVTTPKAMDAPMKSKVNPNMIGSSQNVPNGSNVVKPMIKPDKISNDNAVSPNAGAGQSGNLPVKLTNTINGQPSSKQVANGQNTGVGLNGVAASSTNTINGQTNSNQVANSAPKSSVNGGKLSSNSNSNNQNIGSNTNGKLVNKTPVTLADQATISSDQTSKNVITQPLPGNDNTKSKPIFTNLKGNNTISKLDPVPTHKGSFKASGPIVGFPGEGGPPPKNPFAGNPDDLPVSNNVAG